MREPFRTGLWKSNRVPGNYSAKIGPDDAARLAGMLADGPVYLDLYKNDRKTEDRHPDLNLVVKPAGRPAEGADDITF